MGLLTLIVMASALAKLSFGMCSPEMEGKMCKDMMTDENSGKCFDADDDSVPCQQTSGDIGSSNAQLDSGKVTNSDLMLKLEDKDGKGVYGHCGDKVTSPEAAHNQPRVQFPGSDKDGRYMLIMVDPDAPSRKNPEARYFLHWLVTDIKGSDLKEGTDLKFKEGELKGYFPPSPPPHTGFHRYQFYLFRLPNGFELRSDVPSSRGGFDLNYFVGLNKLCDNFVAGFQFNAEHGK